MITIRERTRSDFAYYHDFFRATEFGVKRDRSTLGCLRRLPMPIAPGQDLSHWTALHSLLLAVDPVPPNIAGTQESPSLFDDQVFGTQELNQKLNDLVNDTLGLTDRERALIHDLVCVKLQLNDGSCGPLAVGRPSVDQIRSYAKRLKGELDAFFGDEAGKWHQVTVVFEEHSGMIQVDLVSLRHEAKSVDILSADKETARQLVRTRDRLRKQFAQWVYFDRNLRLYEGRKTFLFKPMQRFHWTESQAMQDAGEIIAETLSAQEET